MSIWKKIFGTQTPSESENDSVVDIPVSDELPNSLESDDIASELNDDELEKETVGETEDVGAVTDVDVASLAPQEKDSGQTVTKENLIESEMEENEESPSTLVTEEVTSDYQPNVNINTLSLNSQKAASSDSSAKDNHENEEELPDDPEILAEEMEYSEDLSILDGRILPELKVPNWRE